MAMRKVIGTAHHSKRVGPLPIGCRLCVKGAKLVLLATGICMGRCWYCPLSKRKRNKDVVVANEWWVKEDKDVLEEARLCDAQGAGITGGDPMCRLDRTVHHIRLLKREFGKDFHIHLYTPGTGGTEKAIAKLYRAGLDEIRFHPDFLAGARADLALVESALKYDWDVGCEIPVIPGRYTQMRGFANRISEMGVHFLNLNQLEISETNAAEMERRGFMAESDESFAVRGSLRTAEGLLKHCAKNTGLRVHYCTVRLKDGVQLRNRLKRRARNVARGFDIVTGEGLLVRGAFYLPKTLPTFGYNRMLAGISTHRKAAYGRQLSRAMRALMASSGLAPGMMELDLDRFRILTGAWMAEKLADRAKEAGLRPAVVEEYPTWDGLITDLRQV